jgi:UDP-N-acetylmuramoyl-tripeptide--D-alanyl-D-alanine ligase
MYPIPIESLAQILGATLTDASEPAEVGAKGLSITGVSTDSRTVKPGACFFALAGERFDGHDYVAEVLRKGAACAVVSRTTAAEPLPGVVLQVRDTSTALGDLARAYRRMHPFHVVGITGSVGKTTTRQIVHHVLSQRFRVHQAQKSFNNNIGLPLTLLNARPEDEVIVAELGANHPGEIAYLTKISQPDVAVVTNAHPAHLEGFGDLATIIHEKLSIAEGLSDKGVFIVNGDIEPLVAAARNSARIGLEDVPPSNRGQSLPPIRSGGARDTRRRCLRTFGTSAGVDYRAQDIACEARSSTFEIRGRRVHLPLAGPGNVENALAAWAVCDQFGVTVEEFAAALETLAGVSMRAETLQIGTLTVLNDCYNANPASMKNALAMLHNLRTNGDADHRRLVFICGPMAELGAQTEALHAELGAAVAEAGVDLLVTVGDPPRTTARVAREAARRDLETKCFDSTASACDHLQEFLQADDILLIKGSRTARLERVVEELIKDYG